MSSSSNSIDLSLSKAHAAFIDDINTYIKHFLDEQKNTLSSYISSWEVGSSFPTTSNNKSYSSKTSEIIDTIFEPLLNLSSGGKRTRAQLVALGLISYLSSSSSQSSELREGLDPHTPGPDINKILDSQHFESYSDLLGPELYKRLLSLGAAIEMFQLGALIHDDIIDQAELRRQLPTVHAAYQELFSHYFSNNTREALEEFSSSSALLLGDIVLAYGQKLAHQAFFTVGKTVTEADLDAYSLFMTMHDHVAVGQLLDILAESYQLTSYDENHYDFISQQAKLVLTLKSALYSVTYPFQLGMTLGNAPSEQKQQAQNYTIPIGQAFQLRDDILGVLGHENLTGKPVAHDITEGKRTFLLASALKNLQQPAQEELIGLIESQTTQPAALKRAQELVLESGALSESEKLIHTLAQNSAENKPDYIHNAHPVIQAKIDQLSQNLMYRSS